MEKKEVLCIEKKRVAEDVGVGGGEEKEGVCVLV